MPILKSFFAAIDKLVRDNRYYWFDIFTVLVIFYDHFTTHSIFSIFLTFVFGMSIQARWVRGDMRFNNRHDSN